MTKDSAERRTLARELGLVDATSILVGTIIGSAIFLIPSAIASQLHSVSAVLLVWGVGGILSIFGALSLGELGAAFPRAGGLYVYLSHAYGRLAGFLYGWGLLTMIHSGSLATLAVGFSLFLAQLLPLSYSQQRIVSFACIMALTILNCLGIRTGKIVQNVLTVIKLGGVSVMTALLLTRGQRVNSLATSFWPSSLSMNAYLPLGLALIAVLWAYEGWHLLSFTAGELREPDRNLPRAYLYGTLVIAVVYMLANVSYYFVLTPAEIQSSSAVAATAMSRIIGPRATVAISVLILISILGAMNGVVLTGPRVYYAMATDGLFFKVFGHVSARYRTPVIALLAQGMWASLLTLSGSYQQLFTDVIFTAWIFYGFAVAGVIILRHKQPKLDRPYKSPMYPWLPLSFCLAALGITASAIVARPIRSLTGIILILTGVPLYIWFHRRQLNLLRASGKTSSSTLVHHDLEKT